MVIKMKDAASVLVSCAREAGFESDVLVKENEGISASVRMNKVTDLENSLSSSVHLRLIKDKKQTSISINDVNKFNVVGFKEIISRAAMILDVTPDDEFVGLPKLSGTAVIEEKDDGVLCSVDYLKNKALEIESAGLDVKGVNTSEEVTASCCKVTNTFANSSGFISSYNDLTYSFMSSMVAGKGDKMQMAYDSYSTVDANKFDPKRFGRAVGEDAVLKLEPQKIKTGVAPVVFDRKVATDILSTLLSAISSDAIAEKRSFLYEMMGEGLFNAGINIIQDPLSKERLGCRPFDGEGVASQLLNVINKGKLSHWLLDTYNARRLGLNSNGCAVRDAGIPRPGSGNCYIENGSKSVKDLLSDIDYGVYITDVFGLGFNVINGDYSKGVSGFLIKNGKKTDTPVSEFTIAGNMIEIYKNIVAANDLEFCKYKNSPTLLLGEMSIGGSE